MMDIKEDWKVWLRSFSIIKQDQKQVEMKIYLKNYKNQLLKNSKKKKAYARFENSI